jgi:hypothetical protein
VLGGIAQLLLGDAAGPLLLLFTIGGALEGVAHVLIPVALLVTGRWTSWQRWIPLLYGLFAILAVDLPMALGVASDGPGMSIEVGLGLWWFLVGLAVYASQSTMAAPQAAAGQL